MSWASKLLQKFNELGRWLTDYNFLSDNLKLTDEEIAFMINMGRSKDFELVVGFKDKDVPQKVLDSLLKKKAIDGKKIQDATIYNLKVQLVPRVHELDTGKLGKVIGDEKKILKALKKQIKVRQEDEPTGREIGGS